MGEPRSQQTKVTCTTCTISLVRICQRRAWWFGPARFPLVAGMRIMARMHRIDPRSYAVRSDECLGCLRFVKLELKARSPTFRLLNQILNPHFNRIRNRLLSEEELAEGRRKAEGLYGDR